MAFYGKREVSVGIPQPPNVNVLGVFLRVPEMEGVKWTAVSKANGPLSYIHIKSPEKIVPEEAAELGHRSFWESLPLQENEHLLKKAKEEL